jgi:transposase
MTGRKRHIAVDTQGLLLEAVVHPADLQDRPGARLVFERMRGKFPRLSVVYADGGYTGGPVEAARELLGCTLSIVKRDRGLHAFEPLPRRWVVERTFGWLMRCRRLARDYETLPRSGETMIRLAMIGLMLRRLAPRGEGSQTAS